MSISTSMTRRARTGWLLFTLSGVFFFAVGVRERDLLTIAGAVVWTVGCFCFLTDKPDEPS